MQKVSVKTMTAKQAAEVLTKAGIASTEDQVQTGIRQGVYAWGDYIKTATPFYTVYEKLLEEWLLERGERMD